MTRHGMPIEERFWAKVEKTETCWNWTGSKPRGYGHFWNGVKAIKAHRYSYELIHGPIAPGLILDHQCHNTVCVNPSHLNPVTIQQNAENRSGAQVNSVTGVRGVNWSKAARKYEASVVLHQKRHYVGVFQSLKEAEEAVIAKRNELHTNNLKDRSAA